MKTYLLMTLLVAIVAIYLYLKATGRIRLKEMQPFPLLAIRAALFVISTAFYSLAIAKILRATWGYDATPLSIGLYLAGVVAAMYAAFHTTRWLTDGRGVF